MPFVLDASVALAWFFEDETSAYAEAILDRLLVDEAIVPAHWPLEVANALLSAERRGRLTAADEVRVLDRTSTLPLAVHDATLDDVLGPVISLAREQRLTAYDAAYLALAIRERVPLATQDSRLRAAAEGAGVEIAQG